MLGLAVVAFSVGTAYLQAHSTVVPEAMNFEAASRARYHAESGVDVACHYLIYPPDVVADGAYWAGGTNIKVDASLDFVNVRVTRDDSHVDVYQIDSFGFAHDADGKLRAKQGMRAHVLLPPPVIIDVPFATHAGGSLVIGSNVVVTGDIHAEGDITVEGYCNGNVSAGGSITWNSAAVPASMEAGARSQPVVAWDVADYLTYSVDGVAYSAMTTGDNRIDETDADTLNAMLDADTDNPGRIVVAPAGKLTIEPGVSLRATLVVDGDIEFSDSGWRRINAVENYPAIVCSGSVNVNSHDAIVDIVGPVLCTQLDLVNKKRVGLQIWGPLVTTDSDGIVKAGGSSTWMGFYSTTDRMDYYNFAVKGPEPYTILDWFEY